MLHARNRRSGVLFAGLVLCALTSSAGFGQTLHDVTPSIDVVRERLNLTSDQEATLRPLFQQRAADLQQTRAKLEQATSRNGKRAVLRDAKGEADSFNTQVESVLNKEQKAEWRELRDQTREKIKERYERQRESQ